MMNFEKIQQAFQQKCEMERKKRRKEGRKENNFPKNFTIGGSISESDLTTIWFEGVFQSSSLLLPLSLSRLGVSRLSAANSVRFNLRAARVWMLFLESIRAFRIDVKIRFTLGNNERKRGGIIITALARSYRRTKSD